MNGTKKTKSLTQSRKRLSPVARLEYVRRGLKQGKSRRGMARELGCDEGTIRRDIDKLSLPKDQEAAIRNGESAEQYLREHRFKETGKDELAARRKRKWLAKDQKTGEISNDLALFVLEWLAGRDGLTSDEEGALLETVRRKNQLPDRRGIRSYDPARDFAICEQGKVPQYKPARIDYYEKVLVSALYLIEPLKAIRDAALEKALQALRGAEPRPPRPKGWKAELARIKGRRAND